MVIFRCLIRWKPQHWRGKVQFAFDKPQNGAKKALNCANLRKAMPLWLLEARRAARVRNY